MSEEEGSVISALSSEVQILKDQIERLTKRLKNLGSTEFHSGVQSIETRFEIIEGSINILCGSHLNHTNTDLTEFENMHGFRPMTKFEIGFTTFAEIMNRVFEIGRLFSELREERKKSGISMSDESTKRFIIELLESQLTLDEMPSRPKAPSRSRTPPSVDGVSEFLSMRSRKEKESKEKD